jgi:hypothetical protein
MHWIDYVIIFLYIAFAIGVGLYFPAKPPKTLSPFFWAGDLCHGGRFACP